MSAAAHLRALAAAPRPTGSGAVASARAYCRDVLETLGFSVEERPFEYSAFVGEYGTPIGGVAVLAILSAAAVAGVRGRHGVALVVLVVAVPLLLLGGQWLAKRGVLTLRAMRRRGVNLEARRPNDRTLLWLVAHADSKSQPVPLLVRAGGIVLLGVTWVYALVIAIVHVVVSDSSASGWSLVPLGSVVGALPVIASVVGRGSPGAIDNASGVATVLLAASRLPPSAPIGVLITDAEELGLAGARAWSANRERGVALNCDGVDDAGMLTLMWTRPRSARLERAIRTAVKDEGEDLRIIPLIPGVLVDALALADNGWEVVTLSRGTFRTLRRIHTYHDAVDALTGAGVSVAGRALARAAMILIEQG